HRRKIDETVEVLVEGPSKTALKHEADGGLPQLTGRTRTDHIVVFEGSECLIGQTVRVLVEEATAFTLFGTVVTIEQVGVECSREGPDGGSVPAGSQGGGRVALPLI